MSATRGDDLERLVLTNPGEVKKYKTMMGEDGGGDELGSHHTRLMRRVVGGLAVTALVVCAAALSAGPIVGPQLGALASLGGGHGGGRGGGHGGGGGGGGRSGRSAPPPSKPAMGAADYFPETVYLADKNAGSLQRFEHDWDGNHAGGFERVRVIREPNMGRWPKTKDFDVITSLIAKQLDGAPPVHYASVVENGHSVAVREGQEKFAAYSLQHLQAYLEAKRDDTPALLIADRASSISPLGEDFAYSHTGRPEEFDSFILSFLYKGPRKWDVLFCDKGKAGVAPNAAAHPMLSFSNHKWVGKYQMFKWTGEGASGSGLYMVSKSFLSRLPDLMEKTPFTMVDGWLATLCREKTISCLSYLETVNEDESSSAAAGTGKYKKNDKTKKGKKEKAGLGVVAGAGAGADDQKESALLPQRQELSWRDTVVVNPSKVLGGNAALNILNGVGMSSDVTKGGPLDTNGLALPALGGLLVGGDAGAERTSAQKVSMDDLFSEDIDVGTFDAAASEAAGAASGSGSGDATNDAGGDGSGGAAEEESGGDGEGESSGAEKEEDPADLGKAASSKSKSSSSSSKKKNLSEEKQLDALANGVFDAATKKSSSSSSSKTKNSAPSSSSASSTSSKKKSKAAAAGKDEAEAAVDSDDVDSMLDWWSADDAAADAGSGGDGGGGGGGGGGKSKKHAKAAAAEDADDTDEDASDDVDAAAAEAAEEISEAQTSTAHHHHEGKTSKSGKSGGKHAAKTAAGAEEVVVVEKVKPIKHTPILEGEDPMAVEKLHQKKLRKASEKAAREDEEMLEEATKVTSAAADAKAERTFAAAPATKKGKTAANEGGIILDTMTEENAWKYVSRVHHKDEVEAAESAVAAREEEEAAAEAAELTTEEGEDEDGDGVEDTAEEAADVEEMAADVEEELELESRAPVGASKHHHGGGAKKPSSSAKASPHHSSAKSSSKSSSKSASMGNKKHSSKSGTLGARERAEEEEEEEEEPQPVHAHHHHHQQQQRRREEEEVVEQRKGHKGLKRQRRPSDEEVELEAEVDQERLGEEEESAVVRRRHKKSSSSKGPPKPMERAANNEWRAGGAWRSAFAWQQNPTTYHRTKESVFSGADGAEAQSATWGVDDTRAAASLGGGGGGGGAGPAYTGEGYAGGVSGPGGRGGAVKGIWINNQRLYATSALGKVRSEAAAAAGGGAATHPLNNANKIKHGGGATLETDEARHHQHHQHQKEREQRRPAEEEKQAAQPEPDPDEWKRHKVDGPVPVEGLGADEWKEFSAEDDFLDDFGPGSKQLVDKE